MLFPSAELTKLDLAAPLRARGAGDAAATSAAARWRCRPSPTGSRATGYFLKAVPSYFPDWIATATVAKKGGTITHVVAEDAATLVYLAGQNVVTPHPGSRARTGRASPTG